MFYEASSTHNTGMYVLISEVTTALSRLIAVGQFIQNLLGMD